MSQRHKHTTTPNASSFANLIHECLPLAEQAAVWRILGDHLAKESPDLARATFFESAFASLVGSQVKPQSLAEADAASAAHMIRLTKSRVFGEREPSKEGLQEYILELQRAIPLTYEDKCDACRTVNLWKNQLGLEFCLQGVVCTLGPKTSGGKGGGFLVKAASAKRECIWAKSSFPPLTVCETTL